MQSLGNKLRKFCERKKGFVCSAGSSTEEKRGLFGFAGSSVEKKKALDGPGNLPEKGTAPEKGAPKHF